MTEWNTLRARFPDDEFSEIERIKEQYGLSYNEIIRSGVKFYVGLTLAKELVGDALEEKDIKLGGKNFGEILIKSKFLCTGYYLNNKVKYLNEFIIIQ